MRNGALPSAAATGGMRNATPLEHPRPALPTRGRSDLGLTMRACSQYLSVQLIIGVYFGVYGTIIVRRLQTRQQQMVDQRRRMAEGQSFSGRMRPHDSLQLKVRGSSRSRSAHAVAGIDAIQSRRQLQVLMRVRPRALPAAHATRIVVACIVMARSPQMTYFVALSGVGMLMASACLIGVALQWNVRPWGTVLMFSGAPIALSIQSIARTLAFPLRAPAATKRRDFLVSSGGSSQGRARVEAQQRSASLPLVTRNPLEAMKSAGAEWSAGGEGRIAAGGAVHMIPADGRASTADSQTKRMPTPAPYTTEAGQSKKSVV